MAVTIIKKETTEQKNVTHSVKDALMHDLQAMVPDLVFALDKVALSKANLKVLNANLKKLETPFQEHVAALDMEPEQTLVVDSDETSSSIEVGKIPKKRTVEDNVAIFKLLNGIQPDLAFELMAFKLTDLDKYLNPNQLELVLNTTYVGKRPLKALDKNG